MERRTSRKSFMEENVRSGYAAAATMVYLCEELGLFGPERLESAKRELAQYQSDIDADSNPTPPPKPDTNTNTKDDDDDDEDNCYTFFHDEDKAEIAKQFRESRQLEVGRFTAQYQYDFNTRERRICVPIDNPGLWLSAEISSGIMWVGVHGEDSISVVTRRENLDTARFRGNLKALDVDMVRSLFRKSIICEIEDLADLGGPSIELCPNPLNCFIKKPFGVVSANPGTDNVEASDYDENKAIEFLKKKMKRDTVFDVSETTRTAIQAFQHLFRKKVKADEIEVSVMYPDYIYVVTEHVKDSNVEELSVARIEMYLDDTIGESGHSEMDIPL